MTKRGIDLSPTEQRFHAALEAKGEVTIRKLYRLLKSKTPDADPRRMQQRVGAVVSRMNKKLVKQTVKPGVHKRTYCIQRAARKQARRSAPVG